MKVLLITMDVSTVLKTLEQSSINLIGVIESKSKKSKIENRKEKIEKENNIILSDDTESKDSEY